MGVWVFAGGRVRLLHRTPVAHVVGKIVIVMLLTGAKFEASSA